VLCGYAVKSISTLAKKACRDTLFLHTRMRTHAKLHMHALLA
jgi:hypothetical protein